MILHHLKFNYFPLPTHSEPSYLPPGWTRARLPLPGKSLSRACAGWSRTGGDVHHRQREGGNLRWKMTFYFMTNWLGAHNAFQIACWLSKSSRNLFMEELQETSRNFNQIIIPSDARCFLKERYFDGKAFIYTKTLNLN